MTAALLLSVLLSGLLPGNASVRAFLAAGDEGLSYDASTNTVTFFPFIAALISAFTIFESLATLYNVV